jgi:hypothetical protein
MSQTDSDAATALAEGFISYCERSGFHPMHFEMALCLLVAVTKAATEDKARFLSAIRTAIGDDRINETVH